VMSALHWDKGALKVTKRCVRDVPNKSSPINDY
jgi:hypothetical protein